MFKNNCAIILLLCVLTINLYGDKDPLNIQELALKTKADAQKEFEYVIDLFSSGLNSGIYAPVSGKVFSIGVQANMVPVMEEGILKNADVPVLPLPFVYAGLRIPGFGINIFARGIAYPYQKKTVKIVGIGGGWEPGLIPLFSTKLIIHYHYLKDFPFLKGNTFGGTIITAFDKIPLLNVVLVPYAAFGMNNTAFSTPKVNVLNETSDFSMNKTKFQFSAGAQLFKFITLEAGIVPTFSGSVSLGLSF